MRRSVADKHISSINEVAEKLSKVNHTLDYIGDMKLSDYRNETEKDEARNSIYHAEDQIILELWFCSKRLESIIKRIDPEALRELKDDIS